MDIKIIIAGPAGEGVEFAADILSIAFIKLGYYVFNYRYYQSLIRGGENYNLLRICDKKISSHSFDNINYAIVFDQNNLEFIKPLLNEESIVFTDKKILYKNKIDIDIDKLIYGNKLSRMYKNVILLSLFWKYFNLDKQLLLDSLSKKIKDKNEIENISKIFDLIDIKSSEKSKLSKNTSENRKYYLAGYEAIGLGAITSGLDIYISYPMTPTSNILHFLASKRNKYNIITYNPDNEIGVINMALGSSFAGAKVMVGSSGGGIDLMAEAISMAGMAEIPLVIVWGQRYSPSTGMATHHDQSDLLESIYLGHGEFPKVIVSPGDHAEAYNRTIEAFYFAYKYNTPAIILTDLYLLESRNTYDKIEYNKNIKLERFIDLEPPKDYKNYKITDNGYILRTIPGLNTIIKAASYEHDEFGLETENFEIGQKMSEKRKRKMENMEKEIKEKVNMFELYGSGSKLIVSWGSNKMPILEAMKKLKGWRYLHISYLYPFPKAILPILEDSKRVVLIEHNLNGQLGKLIESETGFHIEDDDKILKHSGEPFRPEEIINKLKNL